MSRSSRGLVIGALVSLFLTGCVSMPGQPQQGNTAAGPADEQALTKLESSYIDLVARARLVDRDRAIELFGEFSSRYPAYAAPLVSIAGLHQEAGRDEQAAEAISLALAVNPDYAPARNLLGVHHRRAGRFGDAETAYRAAIGADPGYALAHYNLGVLLDLYLGRPQDAVMHYRNFQALSREPDALVARWIRDLERRHALADAAQGDQE